MTELVESKRWREYGTDGLVARTKLLPLQTLMLMSLRFVSLLSASISTQPMTPGRRTRPIRGAAPCKLHYLLRALCPGPSSSPLEDPSILRTNLSFSPLSSADHQLAVIDLIHRQFNLSLFFSSVYCHKWFFLSKEWLLLRQVVAAGGGEGRRLPKSWEVCVAKCCCRCSSSSYGQDHGRFGERILCFGG